MPDRTLSGPMGTPYGWTIPFHLDAMVTVCEGCRSIVRLGDEYGHMVFHQILLDMATELDQRRNA